MKYIIATIALLTSMLVGAAGDKELCFVTPHDDKVVISVEACSPDLLESHPNAVPANLHAAYSVSKEGKTTLGCWDYYKGINTETGNPETWIGIAWYDFPVYWYPYSEFESCITM